MEDANGRQIKVGDWVKHAQPGHFTTLPIGGARVKELRGSPVILDYVPITSIARAGKSIETKGSNAFHRSMLVVISP